MTDPLDTWKSKEEDAIIARSEEASSKLFCFKCGDGSTPLYCLNCANDELQAKCAEMRSVLRAFRYSMDRAVPFPSLEKLNHAIDSTDCGKAIVERLKEARWLIEHSICRPEHDQRRDQWLKGQP